MFRTSNSLTRLRFPSNHAKFRVAIIRTETQVFTVEAENSSEAIEKISDAWDEGMIELVDPDTCDTDFSLIRRADEKVRVVL